ncbi:MAG: hypothetical protein ACK4R6_02280 [Spirosomataceae bacterium]
MKKLSNYFILTYFRYLLFILPIGFLFVLSGCSLLEIGPNSKKYDYLLVQKSTTSDFGGTVTTSDSYYEYDTTDIEPRLILEYDDNNTIEYDYVSSNHILANFLDYEGNTIRFVDYYLDLTNKNVVRQVLNDTLAFSFKYNTKGNLIQDPYSPDVQYEYENENLVRKKYGESYSEEFDYYPDSFISPYVAFQFGVPCKNILKSIRSSFINEEGIRVISNPLIYEVERDDDGLVISEEVNLDNYQMRIEYTYIKVKKK